MADLLDSLFSAMSWLSLAALAYGAYLILANRLYALDHERDALAHSDAHRAKGVAPAGAVQLVHGGRDEARTGSAERVAERDGPAVGIHMRRVIGHTKVA